MSRDDTTWYKGTGSCQARRPHSGKQMTGAGWNLHSEDQVLSFPDFTVVPRRTSSEVWRCVPKCAVTFCHRSTTSEWLNFPTL